MWLRACWTRRGATVSANREAIAANRRSIERLKDSVNDRTARLEARIDLLAEALILPFTNNNITGAELRNVRSASAE